MTPEQILAQFQQILTTMQRMVAASADTAERVDKLETEQGELLGAITKLQGTLELIEARLDRLEGRRPN